MPAHSRTSWICSQCLTSVYDGQDLPRIGPYEITNDLDPSEHTPGCPYLTEAWGGCECGYRRNAHTICEGCYESNRGHRYAVTVHNEDPC